LPSLNVILRSDRAFASEPSQYKTKLAFTADLLPHAEARNESLSKPFAPQQKVGNQLYAMDEMK
jgi:hypothetical protein